MSKPTPRPKVHDLKTDPESFAPLNEGKKHVELRKDDRDYQAGDLLVLREWEDGDYTGRHRVARVTHILRHGDKFGEMLAAGVVAMSVRIYREPRSI